MILTEVNSEFTDKIETLLNENNVSALVISGFDTEEIDGAEGALVSVMGKSVGRGKFGHEVELDVWVYSKEADEGLDIISLIKDELYQYGFGFKESSQYYDPELTTQGLYVAYVTSEASLYNGYKFRQLR